MQPILNSSIISQETPKFTTVALAGLFCFVVSTIIIIDKDISFLSSGKNESLFALHGTIVCLGLILYSIGSANIPAAELTLLSLTEVIGGIFWEGRAGREGRRRYKKVKEGRAGREDREGRRR